jgi:hypothetical protein
MMYMLAARHSRERSYNLGWWLVLQWVPIHMTIGDKISVFNPPPISKCLPIVSLHNDHSHTCIWHPMLPQSISLYWFTIPPWLLWVVDHIHLCLHFLSLSKSPGHSFSKCQIKLHMWYKMLSLNWRSAISGQIIKGFVKALIWALIN